MSPTSTPRAYVEKPDRLPLWSQDRRSLSHQRRRLWIGRLGWLLALILGSLLLWRVRVQQQEMEVLLNRLQSLEDMDLGAIGAQSFAGGGGGARRSAVESKETSVIVGEKVAGVNREDGLGLPESLGGDGGRAQVVVGGNVEVGVEGSGWEGIERVFVL